LGNPSLLSEVEIIQIADQVYEKLNLNVDILINSKSLFQGICELFGMDEHRQKIATLIDKWDKIGREKLEEEFYKIAAFEPKKVKDFLDFLDNDKALEELETSNENLKKGLEEIAYIQKYAKSKNVKVSNKLVRGLDYYTGIVFEVVSTEMAYGSISGGGRYDNLTEIFGLKNMSGVGFSFGLDRIYDIMLKLGKFPESTAQDRILILNMEDLAMEKNMEIAKALRTMGLQASVYPSRTKMDKQLSYADKSKIDFAIIIGDQELAQNQVTIKNLKERFQATIDFSQIENYFKK
jgi:histidyl-tRNA synthetase